jgi:hypothetical protein
MTAKATTPAATRDKVGSEPGQEKKQLSQSSTTGAENQAVSDACLMAKGGRHD